MSFKPLVYWKHEELVLSPPLFLVLYILLIKPKYHLLQTLLSAQQTMNTQHKLLKRFKKHPSSSFTTAILLPPI